MDKSWMNKSRVSHEYREGVEYFLNFAFRNASSGGKILCPCIRCANVNWQTYENAQVHLICDGFLRGYSYWIFHGETSRTGIPTFPTSQPCFSSSSMANDGRDTAPAQSSPRIGADLIGLIRDAFIVEGQVNDDHSAHGDSDHGDGGIPRENLEIDDLDEALCEDIPKVEQLIKDADEELYPGCKSFSKLSFLLHLYHLKVLNGWTAKSFSKLLELLLDAFPEGVSLPKSHDATKKIVQQLGLDYENIEVCENDCALYWGTNKDALSCAVCHKARYNVDGKDGKRTKNTKILRYFPLIPRLQRLFASEKTAKHMRWHDEGRKKDGLLRHPADGEA